MVKWRNIAAEEENKNSAIAEKKASCIYAVILYATL